MCEDDALGLAGASTGEDHACSILGPDTRLCQPYRYLVRLRCALDILDMQDISRRWQWERRPGGVDDDAAVDGVHNMGYLLVGPCSLVYRHE